ncbi:hypothetical protein CFOLD11_42840 [Clostridium folliculivorans]|uniref:Uncharacterized protein n=1 Tax=Clostridium folliculivorans TaxID=2886038 RepID=A0A9W5Y6G0_9CLOT|nr:hypothetical protein CFOLD11_42840 [Clostridium folliculivorans]
MDGATSKILQELVVILPPANAEIIAQVTMVQQMNLIVGHAMIFQMDFKV